MSQTLSFKITAESAQARAEVDRVIAEVHKLGLAMLNTGQDGIAATAKITSAYSGAAGAAAAASERIAESSRRAMAAQGAATGNLMAQFNDIGVQLAGGQNPLLIAVQQGTQITQALGSQGAGAAVKSLGSSLVGLINPMSLMVVGGIALVGMLVQWGTSALSAGEETKTLQDRVKDLTDASRDYASAASAAAVPIEELRLKYGELADEIQRALERTRELAYAKAQIAANEVLDNTGLLSGLGSSAEIEAQLANIGRLKVAMNEVKALRESIEAGTADPSAVLNDQFSTARIAAMSGEAQLFNARLLEISRTYEITIDQATELALAAARANEAEGPTAQVLAASKLLDVMKQVFGSIAAADAATGGLASKLNDAVLAGGNVAAVTDEVVTSLSYAAGAGEKVAGAMALAASYIDSATGRAEGLAGAFARAAANAWEVARGAAAAAHAENDLFRSSSLNYGKIQNTGQSGPDSVISSIQSEARSNAPQPGNAGRVSSSAVGAGAGGGGAARTASGSLASLQAEAQAALAALDTAIAAINEKVKLGLLTTAEGTEAVGTAKERAATAIAELIPKLEKLGPATNKVVEGLRATVGGFVADIGAAGSDLAEKLSGNFESGFAAFISGAKDGKAAMADFGAFVLAELARIAAQKFTSSIISPLLDSVIGTIFPHAAGGVPEGVAGAGGLGAHANTIVGAPTLFAMAGGRTGLMGEAGPEAILPTRPAPGGGLGVRAQGPDGQSGVLPLQRLPGGDLGVAIAAMGAPPTAFAKGGVPAAVPTWSAPVLRHPPMPFARGGVVAGLSGSNGFDYEDGEERAAQSDAPSGAGRRGSLQGFGAGSGISMPVSIVVHNSGPDTTARAETRQQGGTAFIELFVDQVIDKLSGDVTQGNGPFPQAMQSSYGLSRVGS